MNTLVGIIVEGYGQVDNIVTNILQPALILLP